MRTGKGVRSGPLGKVAQAELQHEHGDAHAEHGHDVGDEKCSAAVGIDLVGEAPQVAQADRRTDGGQDESRAGAPVFPFFFQNLHDGPLQNLPPVITGCAANSCLILSRPPHHRPDA